jgi:16S rRNA (cytosine967-C5)-methyltransferase
VRGCYDVLVISPARLVAFEVLQRVESGGYASDLLLSQASGLDRRDAGLASEIVFGQLDFLIEHLSRRIPSKLDSEVRIALRMGIYQIRHLDRVPAHAAVSESVELVKHSRKRSAVGFVNAVLRKTPHGEPHWRDRPTRLSMPDWLLASWDAQFGSVVAEGIAKEFLVPPETYVRNPPEGAPVTLEATDIPGAYRVLAGDTTGLRIQDIGSQSIVPMLDLRPGHSFLDLCSAPGNKTAQALEGGVIGVACDVHFHRLRNVSGCDRVVLDATAPLPFGRQFDRVLVDAPCSGTGTLGRNPEIRWRIQPSDLQELQEKQTRILTRGLEQLAAGGKLVYSTCSLETAENEEVVRSVHTTARIVRTARRTPGIDPGDGFFATVFEGG